MSKSVLNVSEIVSGTSMNSHGNELFNSVKREIDRGNVVMLSFKDCQPVSSSFLNSSIGELFDMYGFEVFKNRIKVTNISRFNLSQVKRYMSNIQELALE